MAIVGGTVVVAPTTVVAGSGGGAGHSAMRPMPALVLTEATNAPGAAGSGTASHGASPPTLTSNSGAPRASSVARKSNGAVPLAPTGPTCRPIGSPSRCRCRSALLVSGTRMATGAPTVSPAVELPRVSVHPTQAAVGQSGRPRRTDRSACRAGRLARPRRRHRRPPSPSPSTRRPPLARWSSSMLRRPSSWHRRRSTTSRRSMTSRSSRTGGAMTRRTTTVGLVVSGRRRRLGEGVRAAHRSSRRQRAPSPPAASAFVPPVQCLRPSGPGGRQPCQLRSGCPRRGDDHGRPGAWCVRRPGSRLSRTRSKTAPRG